MRIPFPFIPWGVPGLHLKTASLTVMKLHVSAVVPFLLLSFDPLNICWTVAVGASLPPVSGLIRE